MGEGIGMTDADIKIQEARHEAAQALSAHLVACEQRYGELRTRLAKLEVGLQRNTLLLKTIFGTQIALAGTIIAQAVQGG